MEEGREEGAEGWGAWGVWEGWGGFGDVRGGVAASLKVNYFGSGRSDNFWEELQSTGSPSLDVYLVTIFRSVMPILLLSMM